MSGAAGMSRGTHLARFPDGHIEEVEFGKGPWDEMEVETDVVLGRTFIVRTARQEEPMNTYSDRDIENEREERMLEEGGRDERWDGGEPVEREPGWDQPELPFEQEDRA